MKAARSIRPGDGPYPARLGRLADRPTELRVRGELRPELRRVAVVGSREADAYGEEMARELAAGLARAGVSVVSGGARGVDAAAHLGALEAGGHTVAVLGTGVDVAYPARHRDLFERILEAGGALVSELADGAGARREHFPRRNRLVSGMSEAVVVVQAARGSGALITARWARAQGVPLLAVPGDAREPLSEGPIELLRRGAGVAATAADVLAAIGVEAAPEAQLALPDLEAGPAALLEALSARPRHADEVARRARVGPGAALAGLLALELEGLCEQRPGQYFLRRRRAS
jgi:DNA processing protein